MTRGIALTLTVVTGFTALGVGLKLLERIHA